MLSRTRITILVFASLTIIVAGLAQRAGATPASGPQRLGRLIAETHACQRYLEVPLTPAHGRRWRGDRYDHWRVALWRYRKQAWCQVARKARGDARYAIRLVFAGDAHDALVVSGCETGHTYDTKASNGQYLGLFQMGSSERATYGHSPSAVGQARAAYRYFVDSGKDWSPWQCQPNGSLAW